MAKHFRFNLLIKREKTVLGEAVSFLNSYAKYVIVLTQIIVLVVFFIKIVLDQTIIDLKENIDQKNQIILTAQEMVNNNNLIASKLTEINSILNTNNYRYQALETVLTNIPKSIKLNSIQLLNNQIIIDGEGSNPNDIQKMQLKLAKQIENRIKIQQLNKKMNLYSFKFVIEDEEQKK